MLFLMQSHFPRLTQIKISQQPKAFEGYINISSKDYYIHLKTPCFPYAKDISIKAETQLTEILQDSKFESIKFENNSTILHYMKTLQSTCDEFVGECSSYLIHNPAFDDHSRFTLLISHIEEIGWQKVSKIAPDFSSIDLEYRDERERDHTLRVQIPSKYPSRLLTSDADLPVELNFNTSSNKTIRSVYENWTNHLMRLQPFWNVLDDLDETALIIDPAKPLRKHTTRRILLENQVSVQLTLSPAHPWAPPKCQCLGPTSLVTPLNEKLVHLYQAWDENESVVYNIERLLNQKVVKGNASSDEQEEENVPDEWDVDCAVCYCLRLEEQLPDYTCDHCRKSFHLSCLHDWLRSLPSSRQSAQYIRGDCPHCTKAISCKIPA